MYQKISQPKLCKCYNKDFSCVEGVIIPIYLLNVTDDSWVNANILQE
jgi:hypothetical protein